MNTSSYVAEHTGLLLVDPYNDFLSEGGKLHGRAKPVADSVGTLANLKAVVSAARHAGIRVFYVPHHRAEPDDLAHWQHPSPYQQGASSAQVFAAGAWGGEWHPDFHPEAGDVIVKEHWGGSGFANTDLDFLLKQHGIDKVVVVGMLANTCIETTGKFAAELGYHVTLVRDATAAFSAEAMHAAHEINGPTYAHSIVTTAELIAALG
ncbi:cysteine hydrolase [Pseudomonas sp. B21-040]|jgi:nicotinamidase-related amidase|uniref:isochorismatase family cysteine hydrolase n=1 Tax=unclassified Pseudomonas TaxID=196821 RepID=UPI00098613C0|nr:MULTISPECIES: isochorismatase family cysteine hydrolase [unclassified Pseudomonas]OOG14586.1 isochorismatase [Pseudomonas sp. C9]PWK40052.1 nicotinamidase-related amidase [Pseudomonas sp. OV226]UVL38645.1 cysteine hydrolase [Pseudomonas sp. B21-040]